MSKLSQVQSGNVTYELHTLGWKAFQNLCTTITREVFGQTVQNFHDSKDAGRDGAFFGVWQAKSGELLTGSFTIQCKFTAKREKILDLNDLSAEYDKAAVLASKGLATNYIIITNATVTGGCELKIKERFLAIEGISQCLVYGYDWLCQTIRESKDLRMLVPRIYGLGDLSEIIDERAYAQATEILSLLRDDLAKFVITEAYRKSVEALNRHGFVLLLGEPASGKSTIASVLAMAAADKWGCLVAKVRDADDFVRHWNPNITGQLFWVDDAFGVTQFDGAGTNKWNQVTSYLSAAIKKGAKVIFTSRSHIYNSARHFLKVTAFPLMCESQVVVEVEKLSKEEKEQILYNHIRLGSQTQDFKKSIKNLLPLAVKQEKFLPEVARRLGDPLFTKNFQLTEKAIEEFFSRPVELLREIIFASDRASLAALALIFMRGGKLRSPISLSEQEIKAMTLIGGNEQASVIQALNALNGSLVVQFTESGATWWRFKHPTIGEAIESIVIEDRELLDVYLLGASLESLLRDIACGDSHIEGVRIVVPSDRYATLLLRLEFLDQVKDSRRLHYFLTYRCDKLFIEKFIEKFPLFIKDLRIGGYLSAVSDIDVLARLFEFGLLPEEKRRKFVSVVADLAIDLPDARFLSDENLRKMFLPEELAEILKKVREDLVPDLDRVISDWESSLRNDNDFTGELEEALNTYCEEFRDDMVARTLIERALDEIKERSESREPPRRSSQYSLRNESEKLSPVSERSAFEDVDE